MGIEDCFDAVCELQTSVPEIRRKHSNTQEQNFLQTQVPKHPQIEEKRKIDGLAAKINIKKIYFSVSFPEKTCSGRKRNFRIFGWEFYVGKKMLVMVIVNDDEVVLNVPITTTVTK